MKITLLQTAPVDEPGSMNAYARLVETALHSQGVTVDILQLAPPAGLMRKLPGPLATLAQLIWMGGHLRFALWREGHTSIHLLDGSHGHLLRHIPCDLPVVVTAHDIIPLLQCKGHFFVAKPGFASRHLIKYSVAALGRAGKIIVVSSSTGEDLIQVADMDKCRIKLVPSSIPVEISSAAERCYPAWMDRMGSQYPYLIHLGNNGFYKNRSGAIRIFSKMASHCTLRLKMIGPVPSAALVALVEQAGIAGRVDFIVDPLSAELARFYGNACLLLFPSLYEGYGWPPLEAMAFGCPVVCSNVASLPEVVGDAALTGDPDDEEHMAGLCLSILENADLAGQLIHKGLERARQFTPERMGKEILAIYEEVFNIQS